MTESQLTVAGIAAKIARTLDAGSLKASLAQYEKARESLGVFASNTTDAANLGGAIEAYIKAADGLAQQVKILEAK